MEALSARGVTGPKEAEAGDSRPRLFGLPVDPLTLDQTVERCRRLIESGMPAQHAALNAGKVILTQDDARLARIVRRCALVSADGMSIVWAGRLLGIPVPQRVPGIDLMGRLLALAEERGWPVYFLGARPEALEGFVAEVRRRHPRLVIAGRRHGYFDDDRAVAREIAASGARLLFVGVSSPRKERFLAEQLERMGPVFAMGVGGSFDVWAGRTRRAPAWMQRSGLEWLCRLIQEPRRMWRRYIVGNLRFAWLLIRSRLRPQRAV